MLSHLYLRRVVVVVVGVLLATIAPEASSTPPIGRGWQRSVPHRARTTGWTRSHTRLNRVTVSRPPAVPNVRFHRLRVVEASMQFHAPSARHSAIRLVPAPMPSTQPQVRLIPPPLPSSPPNYRLLPAPAPVAPPQVRLLPLPVPSHSSPPGTGVSILRKPPGLSRTQQLADPNSPEGVKQLPAPNSVSGSKRLQPKSSSAGGSKQLAPSNESDRVREIVTSLFRDENREEGRKRNVVRKVIERTYDP